MVRSWVISAVVLVLWTAAAQATAQATINEALSLEDVRRPIYRGNVRYNLSSPNNFLKTLNESHPSRSKYLIDLVNYYHSNNIIKDRITSRKFILNNSSISILNNKIISNETKEIKRNKEVQPSKEIDTIKDEESWSLVQLSTDENQTNIVERFLENSLNDLEKNYESLDKLILSHTEAGDKHIQMYPEGRPPSWSDAPPKANVILVEDVHPSKLPKPQYDQIPLYEKPTRPITSYEQFQPSKPSRPIVNTEDNKPTYQGFNSYINKSDHLRPPVTKPSHYFVSTTTIPTYSGQVITELSHYYEPVISKPSYDYRPMTTKPSHYYEPQTTKPPHYYKPTTANPSHYYVPQTIKPPHHYKPATSKPSHYYEPVPTRPSTHYDPIKPIVSKPSMHDYPEPVKPIKPTNSEYYYPKPITEKPSIEHNTSPSYRPVISSTTHLPKPIIITEVVTQYTPIYIKPPPEPPPSRPPPPTIVVLESPSDNYIDCGTVQVINSASFKDCPDVTVVLNAASSGPNNVSATPPETHAAIVPAASPGSGSSGIIGIVPLPPPPLPPPPLRPPSSIIPVTEEDEEYDYEEDELEEEQSSTTTTTTTAAPAKPQRPTSLLSYLMTSLPFLGPISVSLWIIILGPLSFILIGIMGVASFLVPWLAPSLLFGRIGRRTFNHKPRIPHMAKTFERNLRLGKINKGLFDLDYL